MRKPVILIVDDDKDMGLILKGVLSQEGYQVQIALTGKKALSMVKDKPPHLAILDLVLPDIDGIGLLKEMRKIDKNLPVIMLTGHETVRSAVEAMKLGAYDYFSKPFDNDKLLVAIKRALEARELAQEVQYLKAQLKGQFNFDKIIGTSEEMQKVYRQIRAVAKTDTTVFLQGASGTGKDLIAQTIHYNSLRAEGPFIPVDCASLPETLVESELFGYEKGAFTGAHMGKEGRFELAQKGTIFLDEIGNLSSSCQAKLLRVLQERTIERLGGKRPIKIDVRVIAATNLDLKQALKKGSFREDLYHRLNEFPVFLPPLKDRKDDILLLADHFLKELNRHLHKNVDGISPQALKLFTRYPWPGNVRELKNVIKRAYLLTEGTILPEHLPSEVQMPLSDEKSSLLSTHYDSHKPLKISLNKAKEEAEKRLIWQVLNEVNWKKGKAAAYLGIDDKTLYNKMRKYRISEEADTQ